MKKYNFNEMAPHSVCIAMAQDQDLMLAVVGNMRKYGGSFVQKLAECFVAADENNKYTLAEAFYKYVCEHEPRKWEKKK